MTPKARLIMISRFCLQALIGALVLLNSVQAQINLIQEYKFSSYTNQFYAMDRKDSTYCIVGFSEQDANTRMKDIVMMNINEDLSVNWEKNLGTPLDDIPYDVLYTSDDKLIVVGRTGPFWSNGTQKGLILCFDLNGNQLWTKTIGTNDEEELLLEVEELPDGTILVAGREDTHNLLSGRPIIARFDTNGNLLWSKRFAYDFDNCIYDILVLSGTEFLVLGSEMIAKMDINGNLIWYQDHNWVLFRDAVVADDGNILAWGWAEGQNTSSGWYQDQAVLLKLDTAGNRIWGKKYEMDEETYGHRIQRGLNNDYYLAMFIRLNSSADPTSGNLILKIDSGGNLEWGKWYDSFYNQPGNDAEIERFLDFEFNDRSLMFINATWEPSTLITLPSEATITLVDTASAMTYCGNLETIDVDSFTIPPVLPPTVIQLEAYGTDSVITITEHNTPYTDTIACADCTPYPLYTCTQTTGLTYELIDQSLNVNSVTFMIDGQQYQTNSLTYTFPNVGSYNICHITQNSCGTDTTCQTIDVGICSLQSTLLPSNLNQCTSEIIDFSVADNCNSCTYELFINGQLVSTQPSYSTLLTTPGLYEVKSVIREGCCTDTVINQYTVSDICGLSVPNHNPEEFGLLIYPNPNHGEFAIELPHPGATTLRVLNTQGRVVYEDQYQGQPRANINLAHLPAGVYVVQVYDQQRVFSMKVISTPR